MPPARGALSSWLAATLRRSPFAISAAVSAPPVPDGNSAAWEDEDLQLALWCCYELHYRGFEDVDEDWEWHPAVLAFRGSLERRWLTSLRDLAGEREAVPAGAVPGALRELAGRGGGPDLAGYLARKADRDQFAEFIGHRSVYQLKEADPHSFGIPRLDGPVKAALVEIQADEYGGGRPERMHAELFRATMRWLELDDSYGHYVPAVPAVTLAVSNLMSLFALHRGSPAWRQRAARQYFDEHVEADAVHEQIAAHDLCGGYAADHPTAAADVLFGAACCLALDDALAGYLLSRWQADQPSVQPPAESLRAA